MPRRARNVTAGFPYHIIQRGSRRGLTFMTDDDFRLYLRLLHRGCEAYAVKILAYCLMTNHLHLLLLPGTTESLGRALSATHSLYSLIINRREGWTGCLFQDRYFSRPITTFAYFIACARYIERNPVGVLVAHPVDWPWSSARAHLSGREDGIVDVSFLLKMVPSWKEVLEATWPADKEYSVEAHPRGRPRKI